MKRGSGWDAIKRMFGLGSKKCENGGTKSQTGDCICQKYFTGQNCQWTVCLNGGINVTATDCSCTGNNRYYGSHCELTKCANGGVDNGNGSCDCVKGWYSGKYCETYGSPWLIVFGVAGAILILLLLCCVVYRVGCKSKCKSRTRQNGSQETPNQRRHVRRHQRRGGAEDVSSMEETQPTMIENAKPPDYRPETPPPSYELALSWSRENLDKIDQDDHNQGNAAQTSVDRPV